MLALPSLFLVVGLQNKSGRVMFLSSVFVWIAKENFCLARVAVTTSPGHEIERLCYVRKTRSGCLPRYYPYPTLF